MICNVCAAPKIWKKGTHNRGSGGVAPSRQRILRFSHKKTLNLAHFFMEKGHAVMQSLWTSGVARNFERGGGL